jgi:hypothetical protein
MTKTALINVLTITRQSALRVRQENASTPQLVKRDFKMEKMKCLTCGLMLLMFTAFWIPTSSAEQDLTSKENVSDKESTSAGRVSNQGIPCNWSGWKNSFPEVKCARDRCSGYREILMMKCSDGFITEVKAARVCADCWYR